MFAIKAPITANEVSLFKLTIKEGFEKLAND